MFILGLSIGHDASATILRDGNVVAHVLRERHSGIRHHLGIDRSTIELALMQVGISVADLSGVAIAATQQMPCLINDPKYLHFREKTDPVIGADARYRLIDNPWWREAKDMLIVERWRKSSEPPIQGISYLQQWEKTRRLPMSIHHDWEVLGMLSPLYGPENWLMPYVLQDTADKMASFVQLMEDSIAFQGFHFPLDLYIDGRNIPGWFINHHMAHAASSFYSAPFVDGVIFTHDGGTGIDSGFVFLGTDSKITGLGPHYLECGQFYDYVAERLGLGAMGGAGKLMGLAPYGRGILDSKIPIGTRLDWERWASNLTESAGINIYEVLFDALIEEGKTLGLDTTKIGQAEYVLQGCAPEIAHAVQRMLEESIKASVLSVSEALVQSGLGKVTNNLCLSGGVALNCPSNSELWNTGRFDNIHIEPHCEDGGLSIGAAQYVYHNLIHGKAKSSKSNLTSSYAMVGPRFAGDINKILDEHKESILWEKFDDWTAEVARLISSDNIIAIYYGCYETGPRALGHRSILANPGVAENWERVNTIKRREKWRPFAPAVLADDFHEWFEKGPSSSPFMLFTHQVRSEKTPLLPAVTHVDGSSRVQTVTKCDSPLYDCLIHLKNAGFPPVVLNTSFNGPGQPIVQRLEDAIEMLINTGLDAVFMEGIKITKK